MSGETRSPRRSAAPRERRGGLVGDTSPVPVVTLGSGQMVSAEVEGGDVPVGTATSWADYTTFPVTPPGDTYAVRAEVPTVDALGYGGFPGCRPIGVNPVAPDASGRARRREPEPRPTGLALTIWCAPPTRAMWDRIATEHPGPHGRNLALWAARVTCSN